MKRFVKCYLELLTHNQGESAKVQSAKGLHFAFSACGFGRLLLLDEVVPLTADAPCAQNTAHVCAWRSVPSSRIFRLRLRPLQGPRWQALSRLQAGQVSAVPPVRSWWRCCRPRRDSSSSAVMSYSPIHEKPVSGSRQKAMGLPSGAREDLSWTITRTFGSRFTRPDQQDAPCCGAEVDGA